MRLQLVRLSLIALVCAVSPARALTLAAGSEAPARWATGRVLSAVSDPSSRTTLVVLGDQAGNEVARFTALGAVEGPVRWVVDGMPVFRVGEEVSVGLTADSQLALTGEGAAATTGVTSSVTDLSPSAGGAVPDDPALVTVKGSGFGDTQLDSKVSFPGLFQRVDADVISWSDKMIVCRVPAPGLLGTPQVLTGPVKVWTAAAGWSDGDPFSGGSSFSVLYQWAGDFWPTARLPIRIWVNPADSPFGDDLANFAGVASSQWNVPGSYAHFVVMGLTPVEGGNHNDPRTPKDGRNVVMWRSTWKYDPNILALTWSAIDTVTFQRQEVELEINGTRPWTTDPEDEPLKFDIISTMTHEFGHWLRLGHTQRVPSVMTAFSSPGERRRQISVGDGFGASWIHPSYGIAALPEVADAGTSVPVVVRAFDRQGLPRASLPPDQVEVRAIHVNEYENPDSLAPPLDRTPALSVHASAETTDDGYTNTTLDGLPDGRYRIETYVEGHFVRPATVLRVGVAPALPPFPLALSRVVPTPVAGGEHGRVHFSLPAADFVTLILYDARGRKARMVFAGTLEAGFHDVGFETTGTDGGRLRPGVYWLRLSGRSGPQAATSRVVVLP